ncbi:MAG: hypothetical protein M3011_05175, partial [Actinomycetota bacterium]|nr:hypothetical protein [Actinomycetota bacterium]
MITDVRVEGDQLVAHVRGMDRLWALKSELTIPLSDVVGAEADVEDAKEWLHGIRTGGTHIPGV